MLDSHPLRTQPEPQLAPVFARVTELAQLHAPARQRRRAGEEITVLGVALPLTATRSAVEQVEDAWRQTATQLVLALRVRARAHGARLVAALGQAEPPSDELAYYLGSATPYLRRHP
ncbi:MAG: hypothetical protein JWN48_4610 [Myxococcaceae bacterium]|nr:hypothetical protein [Myxococcaceae bacterium]